jgi:D-inositol-3-phosphate glycosyltransferase
MLSNYRHPHYGADLGYVNAIRDLGGAFPNLNCVFNEAPDASSLYGGASVTICMPLAPEGFGIVPLESVACGTPVIVHPLGGLSWTAGVPGIRIGDPFDARKTCTLLHDMVFKKTLLRQEIAEGRAALEERFSPHIMAARYLAVYERAIKHR